MFRFIQNDEEIILWIFGVQIIMRLNVLPVGVLKKQLTSPFKPLSLSYCYNSSTGDEISTFLFHSLILGIDLCTTYHIN